MTACVSANRTGELFGAISLLHALSRALIPAAVQIIYGLTLRRLPGGVFFGLAGMFGVLIIGLGFVRS